MRIIRHEPPDPFGAEPRAETINEIGKKSLRFAIAIGESETLFEIVLDIFQRLNRIGGELQNIESIAGIERILVAFDGTESLDLFAKEAGDRPRIGERSARADRDLLHQAVDAKRWTASRRAPSAWRSNKAARSCASARMVASMPLRLVMPSAKRRSMR